MGLLQKLKSALGLDGAESSESGRSGDVDVTVEREPSTADEDAVKGTETASSGTTAEPEGSDPSASDTAEAETPSADEFETLADESGDSEPDAAGEAEADADAEADTDVEADTDAEVDADDGEADGPDDAGAAEGSTEPVTELSGIGPAYGDRLAGAGIETVGELAAADAAAVADRIDLGESRVAGWIEQANDY